MPTGKTGKPSARSVPFEPQLYLRTPAMIAGFVEQHVHPVLAALTRASFPSR